MVCENTSSSLGLNVGQGYYDQRIEPIVVKHETSAWRTIEARRSTSLSEEVTRPSLKKAGHVIVHFDPKGQIAFRLLTRLPGQTRTPLTLW